MQIDIVIGDILSFPCDVVVNPTDSNFSGSGGLDKIIRKLGGATMAKELHEYLNKTKQSAGETCGYCLTGAVGLGAPQVMHCVVPKYDSSNSTASFQRLFDACAAIVDTAKKGMEHLAMPAIGCGHGGYPLTAQWTGETFCGYAEAVLSGLSLAAFRRQWNPIQKITIICANEQIFRQLQDVKKKIFGKELPVRDRIRGSLLAGAAGDAFGYPIEFQKGSKAHRKEYLLDPESGKALISDDTQMTLFTACGLLFAHTRSQMHGIGGPIQEYIRLAYFDWLETQGYQAPPHPRASWIKSIPELNIPRAPGNTCLSALQAGGGSMKKPPNNSKGCGAVMRVAPIALYGAGIKVLTREHVADCTAETAVLTHGHPLGWLSAVALCNILYDLMAGLSVHFAVRGTILWIKKQYAKFPDCEYMISLLEKATHYADISGFTSSYDLMAEYSITTELGEGWVGEEALAIAVFCVLSCAGSGFDRCMYNAACHDGDSDSTASLAGQIWGAAFGVSSIDPKWLDSLELRDVITAIADDLTDGCKMSEYSPYRDPVWEHKYIHCDYTMDTFSEHLHPISELSCNTRNDGCRWDAVPQGTDDISPLFLAADSGGSKTVWRILDADGKTRFVCKTVGMGAARPGMLPVVQTVSEAFGKMGMYHQSLSGVYISLGGPNTEEVFSALSAQWKDIPVTVAREANGDAMLRAASFLGCTGVVLCGTGSTAVGTRHGKRVFAGGWGPVYGDDGSGGGLGKDALTLFLRSLDGEGTPCGLTPLFSSLTDGLDVSSFEGRMEVKARALGLTRRDLAALVPALYELYLRGVPEAVRLFSHSAEEIARLASMVVEDDPSACVLLCGGFLRAKPDFLTLCKEAFSRRSKAGIRYAPRFDPIVGACVAVLEENGIPVDTGIFENILNEEGV